ncbi:AMP-binding protein [Mesobacillus maritimus]|uniref:AMP-binding protein n=1 Tax=Mesobacillus maritimus TaxID=1643336 RepID=UPI00384EC072
MQNIINRVAIGDIIRRNAARFPEKVALLDGQKEITYKELDEMTNQFANYLLGSGLNKGDTVATICGNSWEYVVIFNGIAKAGLVWVPMNPAISINEKLYILNQIEAKMILADAPLIQNDLGEVRKVCTKIIAVRGNLGDTNTLLLALDGQSKREPEVDIQDRDVAQIMFTSGTTGRPKGVMTSHVAVYIASLGNIIESNFSEDEVVLTMMPLFHCAQHTFTMSALHRGAKCVIISGFEPENLMKTIHEQKITNMFALPMMYKMILDHPNRTKYDLSSLRRCTYAMAPMDKKSLERCIAEICPEFALGTGQTEMYPSTMVFRPEEQLRRFGSYWGTSSLINDTAIMDDNGHILPKGEVGEIVHRGPNVMNGYFKNEEETQRSREFGWHHTGDLGYWDEDGQLIFVDRKKDIIKTGGENVASILVEGTLLMHDKVANAVAVGLPHEHWAEAVTAFIVLKPGTICTEEEIIRHCREHLGGFQVPKSVIFLDQLPMTATGKIQKHHLRKKFQDHYQAIN